MEEEAEIINRIESKKLFFCREFSLCVVVEVVKLSWRMEVV